MTDLAVGTGAIAAVGTLDATEAWCVLQAGIAREITSGHFLYKAGSNFWRALNGAASFDVLVDPTAHTVDLYAARRSGSTAKALRFGTDDGASQTIKMTIVGAGNIGVGTTSPGALFDVSAAGTPGLKLSNRLTGATEVVLSLDAGNTGIGSRDSQIRGGQNGSNQSYIEFYTANAAAPAARWRMENLGHLRPSSDNAYSLGVSAQRTSVVYSATGSINTSDEREKTWRGAMTEAELAAARQIIAELGFFQWNEEIERKGSDQARYHFGPRAQRVWSIMAAHGLVDPIVNGKPGVTPYAFLCFDEWAEETGPKIVSVSVMRERLVPVEGGLLGPDGGPAMRVEEYEDFELQDIGETVVLQAAGDRYGVRPDQLALFLIAAQEQRLAALEAAIAA